MPDIDADEQKRLFREAVKEEVRDQWKNAMAQFGWFSVKGIALGVGGFLFWLYIKTGGFK